MSKQTESIRDLLSRAFELKKRIRQQTSKKFNKKSSKDGKYFKNSVRKTTGFKLKEKIHGNKQQISRSLDLSDDLTNIKP